VRAVTVQRPDRILLDGEPYDLLAEPLEDLFRQREARPPLVPLHTAAWRGYVASWAVRDGHLYLTDVDGLVADPPPPGGPPGRWWDGPTRAFGLEDLFEPPLPAGGIEATWVSGTLRCRQGGLRLVEPGDAPATGGLILVEVHDGAVEPRSA
jgi:hypothetical protein